MQSNLLHIKTKKNKRWKIKLGYYLLNISYCLQLILMPIYGWGHEFFFFKFTIYDLLSLKSVFFFLYKNKQNEEKIKLITNKYC